MPWKTVVCGFRHAPEDQAGGHEALGAIPRSRRWGTRGGKIVVSGHVTQCHDSAIMRPDDASGDRQRGGDRRWMGARSR